MVVGLWAGIEDLEHADAPNAEEAMRIASWLLWHLSGQKYPGLTCTTEDYVCRPCGGCITEQAIQTGCECGQPTLYRFSSVTGERVDAPSSFSAPRLWLRHRPVRRIVKIMKNGYEIDPDSYDLYDYSFLAGPACCPGQCPDFCDTCITYEYGTMPPLAGQNAARVLANEFVNAVEDPSECKLPERVTSISRQGVSMTLLDPQDFLENGRTGLYAVDLFLKTANPTGALARARVFSPDRPRARHAIR
jgi:hypothetical protein